MIDLRVGEDEEVAHPHPEGSRTYPASSGVAELLKTVDFARTPLGPSECWERSLRSVTALMFDSQFPMFVAWGDELTFLYNDAYAEILGGKHPAAFGARFKDIWFEIWDDIFPLIDNAMKGVATYSEDLPLIMNRAGYDERSWFTFSYSPVRDEHGVVRGMFCAVTETTERVMLQQRQAFHLELEETLRDIGDPVAVMAAASEALGKALDIARVGYGEIDDDEEHVIVERDWTDGRIASVAGKYRMNDFGPPIIDELKAGRVMCVEDVDQDPRVGSMAAAFHAIGSRTVLAVPLIKDGLFRAMLFLHHPFPRKWTSNDIALATEVAERTWSAVERAKSEAEKARYTARLDFLDALGKATSPLNNADAILDTTTRMLGEHLGVSSCAYADMEEDEDGFTIRGDWAGLGAKHITGRYRLSDFGRLAVSELSAARPLVINDNLKEIAPEEAATFQNIGISATICMPLVKGDKLTALMAVHHRSPHQWTSHELALVQEVTDRSWAHIERVRSQAELLASQAELRRANEYLEAKVAERTGELMAAEESLRQAQKMEAVGQLTGGLAHDFNNLLAGMLGSLEVIEARLAQGRLSEIDRYLRAAVGAAKRGASLTQRMLAFSRRQTLAPKPTDVNKLISSMEELVRRSVGPAVAVEVVQTTGAWPTLVDQGQLENALLNLCINGRDAMPGGGKLTIETANRWIDTRTAPQLGLASGQYLSVSVSDTGTGMSADTMARAFDPFFTTKPIGEGTGLGLSMVWGFAGQSGGSAGIYSELGKGTVVSIYLPRFAGAVAAEEVSPAAGPFGTAFSQTVLLVDDEPLIRMVSAEQLQELGYVVIEAGDAREALKFIEADRRIDLLLTDVGLPNGLNGRQLADIAREKRPDLPVLFITGYAENAVLNHGHLLPGMQVMTKPFDMDTLARRVKACMEGH
ncbi:GAF domain-containing protein [Rhizobium leguminosarum]|uniref:GAF domain-containing protein n=1 Tax=Rhizobium leguminosarum TaxID=384 RepID=UPI003D01E09E